MYLISILFTLNSELRLVIYNLKLVSKLTPDSLISFDILIYSFLS